MLPPPMPFGPSHKDRIEPSGDDDTEMDDAILEQSVDALMRRIAVSRQYQVPYLGGVSHDGRIVYVDRDLPEEFEGHEVDRFLVLHELVEQSLLRSYHLPYQLAHQIALRAEREAVVAAGIEWDAYHDFMCGHAARALAEKEPDAPPDLDTRPYEDEGDKVALDRIEEAEPEPKAKVHRRAKRSFST